MKGLEAINAVNGWSMAVLGVLIVFSGLVVLSIAISQLKKVIDLWENRGKLFSKNGNGEPAKEDADDFSNGWPEDIHEIAGRYRPLFESLGDSFILADLYKLCEEKKYPHPYLTIRQFRQEQILTPIGDGRFTWSV